MQCPSGVAAHLRAPRWLPPLQSAAPAPPLQQAAAAPPAPRNPRQTPRPRSLQRLPHHPRPPLRPRPPLPLPGWRRRRGAPRRQPEGPPNPRGPPSPLLPPRLLPLPRHRCCRPRRHWRLLPQQGPTPGPRQSWPQGCERVPLAWPPLLLRSVPRCSPGTGLRSGRGSVGWGEEVWGGGPAGASMRRWGMKSGSQRGWVRQPKAWQGSDSTGAERCFLAWRCAAHPRT